MLAIKRILQDLRSVVRLAAGAVVYRRTGRTPFLAHLSIISLFCRTSGRSNDLISWVIGKFRRPYVFPFGISGVAGSVGGKSSRHAVEMLKKDGYYILEERLPDALCERLVAFATSQPACVRLMDGAAGKSTRMVYQRDTPQAVRYDFLQDDLLRNADIQHLLADITLASLAQDYLGARPVIDIVTMWWHTAFSDKPDAEAAQYFHFDMDRTKWLKYFIYLTDVGPDNGPHSFIAGSHRSGAIASKLLDKGYVRLTDEEVAEQFDQKDFIEFAAPRGTIIVEDTRGLHKGKHVHRGDRLVLQFEYCNSLFGASYTKANLRGSVVPELQKNIHQYPDLYAYMEKSGEPVQDKVALS